MASGLHIKMLHSLLMSPLKSSFPPISYPPEAIGPSPPKPFLESPCSSAQSSNVPQSRLPENALLSVTNGTSGYPNRRVQDRLPTDPSTLDPSHLAWQPRHHHYYHSNIPCITPWLTLSFCSSLLEILILSSPIRGKFTPRQPIPP